MADTKVSTLSNIGNIPAVRTRPFGDMVAAWALELRDAWQAFNTADHAKDERGTEDANRRIYTIEPILAEMVATSGAGIVAQLQLAGADLDTLTDYVVEDPRSRKYLERAGALIDRTLEALMLMHRLEPDDLLLKIYGAPRLPQRRRHDEFEAAVARFELADADAEKLADRLVGLAPEDPDHDTLEREWDAASERAGDAFFEMFNMTCRSPAMLARKLEAARAFMCKPNDGDDVLAAEIGAYPDVSRALVRDIKQLAGAS